MHESGPKAWVEKPVVLYEFRTIYGGTQGFTIRPDIGDEIAQYDDMWVVTQRDGKEVSYVYRSHVFVATATESTIKVKEPLPPPVEPNA